VAVTAFLLMFVADGDAQYHGVGAEPEVVASASSSKESAAAAVATLRSAWIGFQHAWPKFAIAVAILALGWLLAKVLRWAARAATTHWSRSQAISALIGIAVWIVAVAIATSVLVGDLKALVGSLGLVGLALSWALQTPIESFTGWLLNSFQGYYRVGDRVAVAEVFGDVIKIDFLTTTVWEIGSPTRPGFVKAEQPTGRVLTFPNSEVLTGTIMNLTRDCLYVWDEYDVGVANESELRLAISVLQQVADALLAKPMEAPIAEYRQILAAAGLAEAIAPGPQIFASTNDSWTNLTIRYLVPARERRKWKSELVVRVAEELARPEYVRKIIPAYPRRQLQAIAPDGNAVDLRTWAPPAAPQPGAARS